MTSETQMSGARLNPFAFPSDTDFRFVLLIVIVLGASLFIYHLIYLRFNYGNIQSTYQECGKYPYPTNALCLAPVQRNIALGQIGGVALLLAIGGLIYWNLPAWRIWRNGLVPLSAEDAPGVVANLLALCRELGLSKPPIFLWNPLDSTSSGMAFGRFGRYYLAITGGLVVMFNTNRPAFRAVVLHELSHLRNADVDKTYFAIGISWAFAIAAVAPLSIIMFVSPLNWINILADFFVSFPLFILAALVYLTLKAILRSREYYADVRASLLDAEGALGSMLEALPETEKGKWRTMLHSHPDPKERRLVLSDPGRLFGMGFWEAFGTGIAAAIAFDSVAFLLSYLLTGTPYMNFAQTGAAFIFASLAVGVVGLGAWRITLGAMARNDKPAGIGRLGLGLGVGILVGQALSFEAAGRFLTFFEPSIVHGQALFQFVQPTFGFYVLWSILLLISLVLFLQWIVAGASAWVEIAVTSRSPRPFYSVGLIIAGVLLALWLGMLFLVRDTGAAMISSMVTNANQIPCSSILRCNVVHALTYLTWSPSWTLTGDPITAGLITLPCLVSLWGFPLSAWFWRRREAADSGTNWVFLEPSSEQTMLPKQAPLNPGRALKIGLAGGLVFLALLLAIRIWWFLGVSEDVKSQFENLLIFVFGQVTLAALMQAGVAAVVMGRIKRLGAVHGLFAAFVAGCFMAAGILGFDLLFGRTISAWTVINLVVDEGTALALTVLSISFLAGWIRRAI